MYLSLIEIFEFLNCESNDKKFLDAENLLNKGLILNCGKLNEEGDNYEIFGSIYRPSKCSHHDIKGEITNAGKITKMECTCNLKNSCKHIAAILLYCWRTDLKSLEIVPRPEEDNPANELSTSDLEEFDHMKPLFEHECFRKMRENLINSGEKTDEALNKTEKDYVAKHLIEEQTEKLRKFICDALPNSLFAQHMKHNIDS